MRGEGGGKNGRGAAEEETYNGGNDIFIFKENMIE